MHQNTSPSIRINAPPVEVVERFAEGDASVELQLLGAFCQSEVGKGWLVSGRRGGTCFFLLKRWL